MQRRQFIRLLGGGAGALAIPVSIFTAIPAVAQGISTRKLVVVFQRGANDGHNTFVPYTEDNYYDLRPTIAISPPSNSNPAAALELTGAEIDGTSFGLHPAMASLKPLWEAGRIAAFPATHVGFNANRSHFYSQDFIEYGNHRTAEDVNDGRGWINRWLSARYPNPDQEVKAFGFSNPKSLRSGPFPTLSINDLESITLGADQTLDSTLVNRLRERLQAGFTNQKSQLWSDELERIYANIGNLSTVDFNAVQNDAVYPSGNLATQLRQTASLLRNMPGIEIVTIDAGGSGTGRYDTHATQGGATGKHADLIGNFADSISAFYTDMGADMENVAVIVMSEFGRTLDENGSRGTDHGFANTWWILSNSINGGLYGDWPGLDNDNIIKVENRFLLDYAVDYRDVLAEIIVSFMQGTAAEAEAAFPGYTYASTLNFV